MTKLRSNLLVVTEDGSTPLERATHALPEIEWAAMLPTIDAINALKAERNAIVLAHNYMTPDIYHGVADIVGDSLGLAREAARTDADVIVFAGVHFMAETAKITCPDKTVLIPDPAAGCSLAESITGADVRLLRERFPGVPIVAYVNTSADVKAEVDICCTSGNAVEVVRSLGADEIVFLPDQYLGKWVASQLPEVKVHLWEGACMVHERFTGEELRGYRAQTPGVQILAHPECPPDVLAEADYVGSTAGMVGFVRKVAPGNRVVMVTECSMADNIALEAPGVEFVRPCNLCPHMKKITLDKILHSLRTMTTEVHVDADVAERARRSVDRMLAIGTSAAAPAGGTR
ncbi:MAG: quinolinate synthase NadA [Acidimicrobiia bacterium]